MTNSNALAPSHAIGRALLISNDAVTIGQVSESMQVLAISAEVCTDIPTAIRLLNQRKFEAAVVDVGGDAQKLLEKIRLSPANRTVVIFAIADSDAEASEALKCGASFVLLRPLSREAIEKVLKVSYGSIVRERRRYFRCSIQIPVLIQDASMLETSSTVVNISSGGFGIAASTPPQVGVKVKARFTLPGHPTLFAVEATTCWCEEHYVGLQFVSISPQLESELQEWLSQKLEESLPEAVVDRFAT